MSPTQYRSLDNTSNNNSNNNINDYLSELFGNISIICLEQFSIIRKIYLFLF